MKKLSHLLNSLSISLVIILLTNSIGYAKESVIPNLTLNCGNWIDESTNFNNTQGIGVKPPTQQGIEKDCHGIFTLQNQIKRYSLFLNTITNDANIQILPYGEPILIPGLDIEVKASPTDASRVAVATLQGEINWKSATVDASLWLMRSILELIPLPTGCYLPSPDQFLLLSFRLTPILDESVQLGLRGDFIGSKKEFTRAIFAYIDKAGEVGEGMAYDCLWDAAKLSLGKPITLFKITTGYISWFGSTLFDYIRYQGPAADTTVILSYIPLITETQATATSLPELDILEGRWEGPVTQGRPTYYSTILTLTNCRENNTECGSVEYPELSCGGVITFLYEKNGIYYLRENITYGNRCTKEVDLELQQISGNSWKIVYKISGSIGAEANVTKTR